MVYCLLLLVNVMLFFGCYFISVLGVFVIFGDSRMKGDYFFVEVKRFIVENDEYEKLKFIIV